MEKVIRKFRSFEEAEAADVDERAAMTPEQRVEIFFQLREQHDPDASAKGIERVCRVVKVEQS